MLGVIRGIPARPWRSCENFTSTSLSSLRDIHHISKVCISPSFGHSTFSSLFSVTPFFVMIIIGRWFICCLMVRCLWRCSVCTPVNAVIHSWQKSRWTCASRTLWQILSCKNERPLLDYGFMWWLHVYTYHYVCIVHVGSWWVRCSIGS